MMSKEKSQPNWVYWPLVGQVAIPALFCKEKGRPNRVYWLLWVIVNTFGWATRFIIALAVAGALELLSQDLQKQGIYDIEQKPLILLLAFVIYVATVGTIIGVLQQFVLRRLFEIEGNWWKLATILGYALFEMFSMLVPITAVITGTYIDTIARNPILNNVSICGYVFVLGVTQWLVLRRYFTRSGLWIVATAVALWFSSRVWGHFRGLLLLIVWCATPGFIYGVMTAIALAIILKQPEATASLEKRLANLKDSLTQLKNQVARGKPERDILDRQMNLLDKKIEHCNEEIKRRRMIPRWQFWRN